MIPQPPDTGMAKRSGLLRKHYSIVTQFLRHLYDFLPSVCHTPQHQGR
jgi:hypothetical protein